MGLHLGFRIKNNAAGKVIAVAFISLMVLILTMAGVSSVKKHNDINNYYQQVEAVVSRVEPFEYKNEDADGRVTFETRYKVYVDYEVDGELYEDKLFDSQYKNYIEAGDTLKIGYDTRDPNEISYYNLNSNLTGAIVCFAFAGVLVIVVVVIIFFTGNNSKRTPAEDPRKIGGKGVESHRSSRATDALFRNSFKQDKNDK